MRFLIRVLLVFVVIYALLSVIRGAFSVSTVSRSPREPRSPQPNPNPEANRLVKDPVCGMYVAEASAVQANGQFFCSEECRTKFLSRESAG